MNNTKISIVTLHLLLRYLPNSERHCSKEFASYGVCLGSVLCCYVCWALTYEIAVIECFEICIMDYTLFPVGAKKFFKLIMNINIVLNYLQDYD